MQTIVRVSSTHLLLALHKTGLACQELSSRFTRAYAVSTNHIKVRKQSTDVSPSVTYLLLALHKTGLACQELSSRFTRAYAVSTNHIKIREQSTDVSPSDPFSAHYFLKPSPEGNDEALSNFGDYSMPS